jgi:hypothetical protein
MALGASQVLLGAHALRHDLRDLALDVPAAFTHTTSKLALSIHIESETEREIYGSKRKASAAVVSGDKDEAGGCATKIWYIYVGWRLYD